MKTLKIKLKTLSWNNNYGVWLSKRDRLTILKHDYRNVQICGKVFHIGNIAPHKIKGWLPIVSLNEKEVTEHLYNIGVY